MKLTKTKVCSKCDKRRPRVKFTDTPRNRDGKLSWCKLCIRAYNKKWHKTLGKNYYIEHKEILNAQSRAHRGRNPEKRLWLSARTRARLKNLPFNIQVGSIVIPKRCPALGIVLQSPVGKEATRAVDSSPSLDRFKPELGYVMGNVFVVSRLANIIKNNATADQVLSVGRWMKKIEREK